MAKRTGGLGSWARDEVKQRMDARRKRMRWLMGRSDKEISGK